MRAILILCSVFLASVVQCSIYAEDDDSSQISAPHRRPLTLTDLESLDGPLLRQFLTYLQAAKDQSTAVLLGIGVHRFQDQIQKLTGQVIQSINDFSYLASFCFMVRFYLGFCFKYVFFISFILFLGSCLG